MNTYHRTWEAPAKGVMLDGAGNDLRVVGCDVDVYLFSHSTGHLIGACTSTCCRDEKEIKGSSTVEGRCQGQGSDGCCKIMLASDLKLRAYGVKVVRHDVAVAKQHPDVKVIVSNRYDYYTDDLYSSWVNSSNVGGSWLELCL